MVGEAVRGRQLRLLQAEDYMFHPYQAELFR